VSSYTSMTCQSPVCRHQLMPVFLLPPGLWDKEQVSQTIK
jgi:hypothetical protein